MAELREKAQGLDGAIRWAVRGEHRVLERTGPHGTQLIIPPEGRLRQLLMEEVHKGAGHLGAKRT